MRISFHLSPKEMHFQLSIYISWVYFSKETTMKIMESQINHNQDFLEI
jgi:hypothetical protein